MLVSVLLLVGCSPLGAAQQTPCLLADQQPMVVAELFFGRAIPGREPLSEAEWRAFAAEVIAPHFPDGFTVFDGDGQWRNAAAGTIVREPSKILVLAAPPSAGFGARLTAVTDAYKARFRQQSVGILTRDACAAF